MQEKNVQKVSELAYRRIDAETVLSAIEKGVAAAKAATSGRALAKAREDCLAPIQTFNTMAALSFMRFTLNTRDEFYAAEKDYYDEAGPKIEAAFVAFERAFLQSAHCKAAEKWVNPLVMRHYADAVTCTSDEAIPYKIEENKIVTEYTKLMAELTYEFRGEKLTMSALRKYFSDPDREVRKAAYAALGNTLSSVSGQLDDIYDRLVKVRMRTAQVLGYKSFVELGDKLMGRISFDRRQLAAFRENVLRDVVPVVTRLKQALADKLGIRDFMLYDNDTYFACGNPAPVLDAQAMFAAGADMYRDMSPETGEFFDFMLRTDAFDVFPREGKWGGGYCTAFSDYRQPFILANFNGTSADVDVLTHEAGHALADYMLFKQNSDLELSVGGMETAETHSMSMEFFCHKYTDAFFGDRADDYRYMHLFDALTFLPYGTIVDYFQEQVYTHPELSPAERNALWKSLEEQFRPWLKTSGIPYLENGTRWQYQMHIYESPLYYIDYCLAQTNAMQFYFASRKNYADAFEKYMRFVKQGGTKEFPALVKEAGLNSPFEDGALKEVAKKAEEELFTLF